MSHRRITFSRRHATHAGTGVGAALLIAFTMAPASARPASIAAPSASSGSNGGTVTPAAALDPAITRIKNGSAGFAASIEQQAGALRAFVQNAKAVQEGNTSMEAAGAASRNALDSGLASFIRAAEESIPDAGSIQPSWNPQSASECTQVNGVSLVQKGTSACTTNSDKDTKASAQAEGKATATAKAVHTGDANAQAQGDGSAATAQAGSAARAGQAGNTARAVSTGGSTTTADSGQAAYDQGNTVTAAGDGGSLATGTVDGGKNNTVFSGSIRDGASSASVTAGDSNRAIALGADGNNAAGCSGIAVPGSASGCGALATALIGVHNTALSLADGPNSAAVTNAGYGNGHNAAAVAGPDSHARADSAQGNDSKSFATSTRRGQALAFNSYGDNMLAVANATGDGSTGSCNPIGQPVNSGETTYPLDACAAAGSRAASGDSNTAITIVDKAKAFSDADSGARNTAVTIASNGGNIIWNTTVSLPGQPPNPDAGKTPSCPWPLPPPPQAQQACGNGTAKSSYGDGNLAVAVPNGDHAFAWSEASGGNYNQSYTTADGTGSHSRARAIYNSDGVARAQSSDGGHADAMSVLGYANLALANAIGTGSVANAVAAGPHSQANAVAGSGGTASATMNTTTVPSFLVSLTQGVSCTGPATFAIIGTGQSCGHSF